jgi:hypothetical protein
MAEVLFSARGGPWLCLQSVKTSDARWVHDREDSDFTVVEARP